MRTPLVLSLLALHLAAAPVPFPRERRPVAGHEITGRWHFGIYGGWDAVLSSDGSYFSFQLGEVWAGRWRLEGESLHVTEYPVSRPDRTFSYELRVRREGKGLAGKTAWGAHARKEE